MVEKPEVLEYIRGYQESWQLYLENKFSGQLQDRPLLVIFSCFRTKSCALAAGSKLNFLKSWQPKLTLQELVEGDHKSYVWEADDNGIQTKFSPSSSFKRSLETYFEDMGTTYSARDRKEIEECHCVAVGAYSIQQKGWIKGGSVITGRSGKSTVKPPWSRMSLPAYFNPSIREEIGY